MLAEELLVVFPNPFRAAAALYRAVKTYFRGDRLVVAGRVRDRRRRLCNKCFWRDPQSDQCRKCTCFLALKVELTTEKCPIDRW
jgi:hypothetical protein